MLNSPLVCALDIEERIGLRGIAADCRCSCCGLKCVAELECECSRQLGHPFSKRAKRWSWCFFPASRPRLDCAADHASVFALPLLHRRKSCTQAELFRIARVNA